MAILEKKYPALKFCRCFEILRRLIVMISLQLSRMQSLSTRNDLIWAITIASLYLLQCVEGSFLVTCCIRVRTVLRRAAYFFAWKFVLCFYYVKAN